MNLAKHVITPFGVRHVLEASSLATTSVLVVVLTSTSVEISVIRAAKTVSSVTLGQINVKSARMTSLCQKVYVSEKKM